MNKDELADKTARCEVRVAARSCQSIEWYAEGQTRIVDVDGVRIAIRFVGRRGRRARIAISGPPGTVFSAGEA